jgi:hypothetical protein
MRCSQESNDLIEALALRCEHVRLSAWLESAAHHLSGHVS